MNKPLFVVFIALLLLLPAPAAPAKKAAATKATDSKLAGLPAPVVATIYALQGNGKIGEVNREVEDGEELFEVEISHGAVTRTHTLDASGVQLGVEVFMRELIPAVQSTIKAEAAGGKVEYIGRSIEEGKSVFDVEITRGGKKHSVTISSAGRLLSRQTSLAELPPNIQKAINAQLHGGRLGSVVRGTDSDGDPYFYAASIHVGRVRWFTLDEDGDLISEEEKVALAQTPEPVQQTILKHLGTTEHVRISRVQEEGGVRFDLLAMKQNSTVTFAVAPDGKILPANEK